MTQIKNKKIVQKVNRVSIWVLWLAVFGTLPAAVLADEAWTSNVGNIVWEEDVNNTAIFLYKTPSTTEGKTRLFIRNLVPDTAGRRGTYSGYWTDDSKGELCEAYLTDPKGTETRRWGRMIITFEKAADGLWNFTASVGDCFDEPSRKITAKRETDEAIPAK